MGANRNLERFGLAARKHLAIHAALEVHRDPIAILRGALHFDEIRTLRAHALDHGLHILVSDCGDRLLDRDAIERMQCHLGQDLEDGRVTQFTAWRISDRFDARATGGTQLLLADGLGEGALHQIIDGLRMHLRAELLAHHGEWHFARPEAFQARRARKALESRIDLAGHTLARHRHFQPPLESFGRRHRNLHLSACDLELHAVRAAWCERRDSNSHGLPHWLLRPARLPFRHFRAPETRTSRARKELGIIPKIGIVRRALGPTRRSSASRSPTALTAALAHTGSQKSDRRRHYAPINTCYRRTWRATRRRRLRERTETHRRTVAGPFAGGSGGTRRRTAICERRPCHGPQQTAASRLGSARAIRNCRCVQRRKLPWMRAWRSRVPTVPKHSWRCGMSMQARRRCAMKPIVRAP